jgi:hypothetical protein
MYGNPAERGFAPFDESANLYFAIGTKQRVDCADLAAT